MYKFLSITISVVLAFSCSSMTALAAVSTSPSLFDRLGGEKVMREVVDETIDRSVSDPRTKRSFEGIKIPALKDSIFSHLCHISDGPCKYEGETMKNAHKDAKITEAEFEAMVSILREVLDQHVQTREKNELLRILAPMKRDVIVNLNEKSPENAPNQNP